jgi:predicted metalloprotease
MKNKIKTQKMYSIVRVHHKQNMTLQKQRIVYECIVQCGIVSRSEKCGKDREKKKSKMGKIIYVHKAIVTARHNQRSVDH